jgi:hypothetical protein
MITLITREERMALLAGAPGEELIDAAETAAAGAPRVTDGGAGHGHADPAAADSGPRAAPPADGAGGKNGKDGGPRLLLRLSGPGVPGTRAVIVTGLPAGFAAARRRLVAGFPAGADLLLIAPDGAMTGLPRTTVVREEAC